MVLRGHIEDAVQVVKQVDFGVPLHRSAEPLLHLHVTAPVTTWESDWR